MAKTPSDDLPELMQDAAEENSVQQPANGNPTATEAALTLIAANLAMKTGTSLLRGTIERAILRGRFGDNAAERILKEKTVKGSSVASRAAKIATRSKPGAAIVGAGLFAKLLFDKAGARRQRLAGKKSGSGE